MQVSLTNPALQRFIENQVKQGRFASPRDVVEAALERFIADADDDFDEETLDAIRKADAQLDAGEGRDLQDVARELRARYAR